MNWPDLARVHREETVEEDKNANQGRRDQHASVPAQPRKVKTDFLTEVPPGRDTVVRIPHKTVQTAKLNMTTFICSELAVYLLHCDVVMA